MPFYQGQQLLLNNMFDHRYEGFEGSFEFRNIVNSGVFRLGSSVSFLTYKDTVMKIADGFNRHAITGFSEIYKGIVVGEQVGSILGSSYAKSADGQMLIDSNGFPVKNIEHTVIGNVIPDFTVKTSQFLVYKNWKLNVDWQWNSGGQIYNGTQAALDYYGRSFTSGTLRNKQNYVFSGVLANGNPNQQAVTFYDPEKSVYENRWTRYGVSGIAEAYIEQADFVKINTISLSVDLFSNAKSWSRRNLTLTGYVSNLYLWRNYSGVDPLQHFYGEENGNGLDFFNLPGYTGFGVSATYQF